MKKILVTLLALSASSSFASLVEVPEGYLPILDCPAAAGAPDLTIARGTSKEERDTFFLATLVKGKTKMIELRIEDGDMGYSTFVASNKAELGALKGKVQYIYVNNDEEDRADEDMKNAVVTSGTIRVEGRDADQECSAIGSPLSRMGD